MKRPLTRTEVYGLMGIVLVGGLFAYFFLFFEPVSGKMKKVQKELTRAERTSKSLSRPPDVAPLEKEVQLLSREQAALVKRIKGLPGKTREEVDAQQVIADITRVAMEYGMAVTGQTYKGPEQDSQNEGIEWYHYDFSLEGSYGAVPYFVQTIQKANWVAKLNGITISAPKKEENRVLVRLQIFL